MRSDIMNACSVASEEPARQNFLPSIDGLTKEETFEAGITDRYALCTPSGRHAWLAEVIGS